jgi:hypothetical protein
MLKIGLWASFANQDERNQFVQDNGSSKQPPMPCENATGAIGRA